MFFITAVILWRLEGEDAIVKFRATCYKSCWKMSTNLLVLP